MRRRWSQIAGSAIVLFVILAVFLINNQARQGDQPTTAPAATASHTPTGTAATTAASGAATATSSAPATATRTVTSARATATPQSAIRNPQSAIPYSQLPPEAQRTIRLIDQGGPFPYDRDGIVFGNRERLLPLQAEGYYHEYTVVTPGSSDRGARRIIAGERGELYYTDDHYDSFKRVTR